MSTAIGRVRCVQAANAILGEAPTWDVSSQVLYWADLQRPAIFRWDLKHGQTGHWPMPKSLGCIAPTTDPGQLVFTDAQGFGFLDTETGDITRTINPDSHLPGTRFNDGKVDRKGRLWAGSADVEETAPTGSLYRLDSDGSVYRKATGLICSNGIGWSPNNRTMYFTDSMVRTIWSYEFDLRTGELGERTVFVRVADDDGVPDGLTVDSEGYVWSALWDGWRVLRFNPDGVLEREFTFPYNAPPAACSVVRA